MSWWVEHVVPRIVDNFLDVDRIHELRSQVCVGLSGDILEIGFGSALNIYHYPDSVHTIWAVDPSNLAWRLAQRRVYPANREVIRIGMDGQRLDLPAHMFDAALSTFSMCTIPDLDACLSEVSRVLKPGAALHFLEHGRSPDSRVAAWQDRLQPLNGRVAGGCRLNRPIGEHLGRSDLVVEDISTFYDKGPKPFTYLFQGRARKPT